MISLKIRLILSYLLVIMIGMGLAGGLAWLVVEQLYLDSQRANLLAQAKLVALTVQTESEALAPADIYNQKMNVLPGVHTYVLEQASVLNEAASSQTTPLYNQTSNTQPGIHTYMVMLDVSLSGNQPSQSAAQLPELVQSAAAAEIPNELFNRPEIIQARAGQPDTAIRHVEIAGNRRVLYAAAPVVGQAGTVSRIVYIASPLPDTSWAALPVDARWQLLGALGLALGLACAVGWYLSSRIARPLSDLLSAADAVAAGDLGQRVAGKTAIPEIQHLGQSFNQMTASLRQADQAKTMFVANVSHELRTPLTIIKGNLETLQDGALDDPEARDIFLGSVVAETERLIRLVNDLLVLTRADAGVLKLQREVVDLGELAQARAHYFARLAAQRHIAIQVVETMPERALPDQAGHSAQQLCVLADPHRVTQVLDNLLDNAIRHTGSSGRITITIAAALDQISCAVSDTGSGISADHLPLIFERFYRADPARSRYQGGCGLGLAIAQALVQAHGGRIEAQSVEQQGTMITFWLPMAPP